MLIWLEITKFYLFFIFFFTRMLFAEISIKLGQFSNQIQTKADLSGCSFFFFSHEFYFSMVKSNFRQFH